jgi:hypothetical protein
MNKNCTNAEGESQIIEKKCMEIKYNATVRLKLQKKIAENKESS